MSGKAMAPLTNRRHSLLLGRIVMVALLSTALGWAAVSLKHFELLATGQWKRQKVFRMLPRTILTLDKVAPVPGL